MNQIRNKTSLIEKANTLLLHRARKIALQSLEYALQAVDPETLMHRKFCVNNSNLTIDKYTFDLKQFNDVYVVGGGKASGIMAEVVEEVLGTRITAGAINVPHGSKHKTNIIKVNGANHPIPDQEGVKGARYIISLADQATEKDLIICLVSGGGSSLMPLPREGISLEDKRTITSALLKSGAAINEINTVRKHISALKGGWLAKKAYPATVINLTLSDVICDPLDAIASGPTVPDHTTFADAQHILKKYKLWVNAPASIHKVIYEGVKGIVAETPKAEDPAFKKVYNIVIGNNKTASTAAREYLEQEGLNALVLSTTQEGEAKNAGAKLADLALKIAALGEPLDKPAAVITGGETTVIVKGKGIGGRNQELTLAAALKIKGVENCVVASLNTDGIDGPTDAAGAIADGYTLARAEQQKIDAEKFLTDNNSYTFFSTLGDLIITGATGTNVNDISVIIVL